MRDYEDLLRRVLKIIGEDRREEVEEEVERRMVEDPRLTRLGALYVVAGELGVFESLRRGVSTVALSKLVGGLGSVNIEARVIGLSRIVRRGQTTLYLRLADSTGVVDAAAWGPAVSKLETLNLGVGAGILVENAFTRERPDGSVEVLLGDQAEVSMAGAGLPPLSQFFKDLGEVFETRGAIDFRAVVLGLSEARRVNVRGEETGVRDVLLGWRGVKAELSLWRELADVLDESSVGREIYVAGAKWSPAGRITTSSRTGILLPDHGPAEPRLIKVERDLHQPNLLLGITGEGVERIYSENIRPGEVVLVKGFKYVHTGRSWVLVPGRFEPWRGEYEARPKPLSIRDLRVGMVDVYTEGELLSKSPLTRLSTRRGEIEFSSCWIRDETGSIFCKAWGGAASMLAGLEEGWRVALYLVRVLGNPWGEREIHIGEDSLAAPSSEPN
ncbi:MAG: hypothetical protein QXW60_06060 [Nitrososphaerota archaeon]